MPEKKKKRKREEIDYHDPSQRVHPPIGANPGNTLRPLAKAGTKRSKQNQSCPICSGVRFEWGMLYRQDNFLLYQSNTKSNGKSIRTRRCLNCDNLQLFTNS